MGATHPRRNYAYGHSEDEDSTDHSDQDTELDEEGQALASLEEEEELVDSAMRRIRRAQASGKQDVKLSKRELSALENQRKRLAEASNEKKKKKKREQRYAVPLSQFGPISHKETQMPRPSSFLPAQHSTETLNRAYAQNAQPPVGWFAHPSSSRPDTSDSRRPPSSRSSDREHSSSPFQYSYVQQPGPPSNARHLSDPISHPRSTRASVPHEDAWMPQYNPSASTRSVPASLDPFRYMTAGTQSPYPPGSAPHCNFSSSSRGSGYYEPPRAGGSSRRQSRHITPDDEESTSGEDDNDEDDTSDEVNSGAHIGNSQARPNRNGREQIIVEVAREPTPEPRVTRSKKTSTTASPKRKPTSGGTSRKKKGSK